MALATKRWVDGRIEDVVESEHPRRLGLPAARGMDWSQWAFGCSLSGSTVTVESGRVLQGTRTPIAVSGTEVEITVDQTWIWVEYVFGAANASIQNGTTEPRDAADRHRRGLSLWKLDSGIVSRVHTHHAGDIVIPGAFA